jgi:hypothetical protein
VKENGGLDESTEGEINVDSGVFVRYISKSEGIAF